MDEVFSQAKGHAITRRISNLNHLTVFPRHLHKNTKTKSGRVEKITPKNNGKKRGPYKLSTYHNIKDKKERKKAQNVEAARRYRDKKKAESDSVFAEEAQLAERNKKLRSKAAEIENEVKTLKKLMDSEFLHTGSWGVCSTGARVGYNLSILHLSRSAVGKADPTIAPHLERYLGVVC